MKLNFSLPPSNVLPLWHAAAEAERRRYPRHVRVLAARHGLALPTAALIADIAGIGGRQ